MSRCIKVMTLHVRWSDVTITACAFTLYPIYIYITADQVWLKTLIFLVATRVWMFFCFCFFLGGGWGGGGWHRLWSSYVLFWLFAKCFGGYHCTVSIGGRNQLLVLRYVVSKTEVSPVSLTGVFWDPISFGEFKMAMCFSKSAWARITLPVIKHKVQKAYQSICQMSSKTHITSNWMIWWAIFSSSN